MYTTFGLFNGFEQVIKLFLSIGQKGYLVIVCECNAFLAQRLSNDGIG